MLAAAHSKQDATASPLFPGKLYQISRGEVVIAKHPLRIKWPMAPPLCSADRMICHMLLGLSPPLAIDLDGVDTSLTNWFDLKVSLERLRLRA